MSAKKVIKAMLWKAGIEIRRRAVRRDDDAFPFGGYDMEEEVREAVRIVKGNTMVPYARLVVLYQQAVFCERHGIERAFVECGTWKGGAVGVMALVNMKHRVHQEDLHLVDSFQNTPAPIGNAVGRTE